MGADDVQESSWYWAKESVALELPAPARYCSVFGSDCERGVDPRTGFIGCGEGMSFRGLALLAGLVGA